MKKLLLPCFVLVVGCGAGAKSYVRSDTTLGRVVVYRNGVAYFERYANVTGDELKLSVPADKVDDFLKSLTVVDARTGEPAPIAYPTVAPTAGSGLIDMKIRLPGASPHELKLSYVTESPSWKPSYRVVIGKDGKVGVQAWAIVDNTSGEDWNQVRLGVGSSSAMSFRFDLQSVRVVARETLQADNLFALAPPIGQSSWGSGHGAGFGLAGGGHTGTTGFDLPEESLAMDDASKQLDPERARAGGRSHHQPPKAGVAGAPAVTASPVLTTPELAAQADSALAQMAQRIQSGSGQVRVEGYATDADKDKLAASLERANKVREKLVRDGVDPSRVVAVGAGLQAGRAGGVRVLESTTTEAPGADGSPEPQASTEPIGTSHFDSTTPMNVPRGTSAMVSILHADTEGQVVYLYDPDGVRGNAAFPFRAVRIKNPTDSSLESGPVTVFGEGRFIGEGMAEPIPARATAFVPFALDRQIVAEKKEDERDEIAKIITVQRGVFSTEVKHTRKSTVTLHNRLAEKATVYVRHIVAQGYELDKAAGPFERMGNAHLFRVELEPNGSKDVEIEESTKLFKTTDIRTDVGLDMVSVFLSSAAVQGPLKAAVAELLSTHRDMTSIEQHIGTMREQMSEYRQRMDELHAQIVTLRVVRTAGPLMQSLEKKMAEISDKLSKATIDLVALEEKRMVARIHFQDRVAELTLEKAPDAAATAMSQPAP